MKPDDLPPADRYAHGTRARYVSGCRCAPCREANTAYERMRGKLRRAGLSNELVEATEVREHLVELSRHGVGRRTVSEISGVAQSAIADIVRGTKTKLRRQTAAKILEVDADALNDAKLVDARPTWKLLRALMDQEDWTRGELAVRLGFRTRALQIKRRRVTAKTAMRVERFYRTWQAGYSSAEKRSAS